MDVDNPVEQMTLDECWTYLEHGEFGRLAFLLVDEVHVVPMNYVVDDGVLLFRTTSGDKLLAAALHANVALEIDEYDEESAWSVVVRGHVRRLEESEFHRLDDLQGHPWVAPEQKQDGIELRPEVITGRRFLLQR